MGLRGGCEARRTPAPPPTPPQAVFFLSPESHTTEEEEEEEEKGWVPPRCRKRWRRRKSPRRRWKATTTSCRPAPSWRALCSVSRRHADQFHPTSTCLSSWFSWERQNLFEQLFHRQNCVTAQTWCFDALLSEALLWQPCQGLGQLF